VAEVIPWDVKDTERKSKKESEQRIREGAQSPFLFKYSVPCHSCYPPSPHLCQHLRGVIILQGLKEGFGVQSKNHTRADPPDDTISIHSVGEERRMT